MDGFYNSLSGHLHFNSQIVFPVGIMTGFISRQTDIVVGRIQAMVYAAVHQTLRGFIESLVTLVVLYSCLSGLWMLFLKELGNEPKPNALSLVAFIVSFFFEIVSFVLLTLYRVYASETDALFIKKIEENQNTAAKIILYCSLFYLISTVSSGIILLFLFVIYLAKKLDPKHLGCILGFGLVLQLAFEWENASFHLVFCVMICTGIGIHLIVLSLDSNKKSRNVEKGNLLVERIIEMASRTVDNTVASLNLSPEDMMKYSLQFEVSSILVMIFCSIVLFFHVFLQLEFSKSALLGIICGFLMYFVDYSVNEPKEESTSPVGVPSPSNNTQDQAGIDRVLYNTLALRHKLPLQL